MRRIFSLLLVLIIVGLVSAATTIRVGVVLPLKEQTARGTALVEFYRGLLMAVEVVKAEGLNVEVTAVDCGNSETSLQQALRNPALPQLDILFGPVDAVQVGSMADFCRQHGIRMILPFNTPCTQIYTNPWIYQVGVSQELLFPGVCNLVMQHMPNSNFVFFYTTEQDDRGQAFSNHLSQVLQLRNQSVNRLAYGADEFAFDRALNQFRENVIIPDARSQSALSKTVSSIKAYLQTHPQYKITLLGYPEWLTYVSTQLQDLYQFNAHVFSPYYRNPLSGRTAKFEQQYQQNFNRPSRLSFPKAEMLGYDLGLYFMRGVSQMGRNFEDNQSEVKQQPLQHYFDFQRVSEEGGFANLSVELVHYTTNKTIQVLK